MAFPKTVEEVILDEDRVVLDNGQSCRITDLFDAAGEATLDKTAARAGVAYDELADEYWEFEIFAGERAQ